MGDELRRMNGTLFGKAGELSPADYIGAKQFLGALESAVRSLRDPNLGSFLNLNGETRARNVAELVELMGRKGLKFAPATPGDEPAYRYLYQRMLAYDSRIAELAAKP
jgi:hypothetical protein